MIVVDPVTLGDTSLSGGGGSYWDKAGVLQTAAPGTPRITYDPADLTKPPAVMVEPEATNLMPHSYFDSTAVWIFSNASAIPASGASPRSLNEAYKLVKTATTSAAKIRTGGNGLTTDDLRTFSMFAKAGEVSQVQLQINGYGSNFVNAIFDLARGTHTGPRVFGTARDCSSGMIDCGNGWWRIWLTGIPRPDYGNGGMDHDIFLMEDNSFAFQGDGNLGLYLFGANITRGNLSSYIHSVGSPVTRTAELVGATAGLLYSNVAEPEPLWAAGTYAKGAKVRDAAHVAWESLVDGNTAVLPSKTDANWLRLGATNRWAMFDDRNNTQTSSAEELIVVLSPRAIAQGLLLGNLDANEIGVAVTVPNYGVVYRETSSLVVSTSNSSFFRWGFNRIRRKNLFLSLSLPIYFNGVVTITIRRPGGVAKCGMCLIGPITEPGPTFIGLSTEIKDYSTTIFNTDGSSETTPRGYRKLMSMDVSIDTEKIVEAEDQMIAWKQKTVAWIGAASRPDTVLVGRYSSFKKVIESYPRSKMALQIEGVLS